MARLPQLMGVGLDEVKLFLKVSRWPPGISILTLTPGEEIVALRREVEKVLTDNGVKNVDLRSGPLTIAKRAPDKEMPNGGIRAMWQPQDLEDTEEESDGDEDVSEDEDESADEKHTAADRKPKHIVYLLSREQINGEPVLWNEQLLAGNCGTAVAGYLIGFGTRNAEPHLMFELIHTTIRRTLLLKFIAGLSDDEANQCIVCYESVHPSGGLRGAKACTKCVAITCDECTIDMSMDAPYASKKASGRLFRCPICAFKQEANFTEMVQRMKPRVVSEHMKEFLKFWTHMSQYDLDKAVLCDFKKMTAKMRVTIREDIDRQFFDKNLNIMKMRTEVGGCGKTKAEWRRELKRYRRLRTIWRPLLLEALGNAESGRDIKIVALSSFDKKKNLMDFVKSDAYDTRKAAYMPVTAEMLPAVAKMRNVKYIPLERMDDRSVVKASSERVAVGSVERSDRCALCQKAFWDKKEQRRAPKCAKCKRTAYCSTQCRKKHRVVHSRVCKGKKKRKKKL